MILDTKGILNILATKLSALIDLLSCYPPILSKCTPYIVADAGFVENVMLVKDSYCYPDMLSIICICKTVIFTAEINAINRFFTELYK